ncbi:MAG: alanine racemase [Pseudomonadota bacterium]
MTFDALITPSLLLDKARFFNNIAAMAARAKALGVRLRPHMKTCKSVAVGRHVLGGDWDAIAVSTLVEARAFFEAGVRDIRYTAPFAAEKLAAIAPMIQDGLHFEVLLDNAVSAARLGEAAAALNADVAVMIELDIDGYRGGCRPDGEGFQALLRTLDASPHLSLQGLYSYGGKTYGLPDRTEREALIEKHRRVLSQTAETLRKAGRTIGTVGLGGSPPLQTAQTLEGLTEACAGVFVFEDLAQAGVGVTRLDDIAVTVLASVVQHAPDSGRVYIDAGSLALAQDRSTAKQAHDQGYGLVCDAETCEPLGDGDLIVAAVSQEHGQIRRRDGGPAPAELLPVGARVRVMPNHVCMTANPYEGYHVVEKGAVTAWWPRANGWSV